MIDPPVYYRSRGRHWFWCWCYSSDHRRCATASSAVAVLALLSVVSAVVLASFRGWSVVSQQANESHKSLDRPSLVTNYINSIKLSDKESNIPLVLLKNRTSYLSWPSPYSAEERALAWLVYDDPLQLVPNTTKHQLQLQQRYAVLTVHLQSPLHVMFMQNKSFRMRDECDPEQWSTVEVCSAGREVKSLTTNRLYLGTIPADLGLLTALTSLDLDFSRVAGSMPDTLGRLSNLKVFGLFGNNVTGTIPASIGSWTNLHSFIVARNNLSGTIPSSLNNWTGQIKRATFGSNHFSGSIPDGFCHGKDFTGINLEGDCERMVCPCCTTCFLGT